LPTEPESEVVVGKVGRPHGVDGAFVVEQASEDPDRFAVGQDLLVGGVPARIVESRQVGGRRRAIKLDRAVARGTELAVPRDTLPALPEDSYYVVDLVGMAVVDEHGSSVGTVHDVLPGPANDVLELDDGRLLPLVEDCVREVDMKGRRILLNPGFTD
jgi:16S rRNA processing protein RimM